MAEVGVGESAGQCRPNCSRGGPSAGVHVRRGGRGRSPNGARDRGGLSGASQTVAPTRAPTPATPRAPSRGSLWSCTRAARPGHHEGPIVVTGGDSEAGPGAVRVGAGPGAGGAAGGGRSARGAARAAPPWPPPRPDPKFGDPLSAGFRATGAGAEMPSTSTVTTAAPCRRGQPCTAGQRRARRRRAAARRHQRAGHGGDVRVYSGAHRRCRHAGLLAVARRRRAGRQGGARARREGTSARRNRPHSAAPWTCAPPNCRPSWRRRPRSTRSG